MLPSVDAAGRAMPGAFGREAAGQGALPPGEHAVACRHGAGVCLGREVDGNGAEHRLFLGISVLRASDQQCRACGGQARARQEAERNTRSNCAPKYKHPPFRLCDAGRKRSACSGTTRRAGESAERRTTWCL